MPPGLLLNGTGGGVGSVPMKKRIAPQPPGGKQLGKEQPRAVKRVEDSYSTMSTMSANSTVSEKSIKVKPTRKALPRKISSEQTPNLGWLRVYCGPDQNEFSGGMDDDDEDPNKVLQVSLSDSVKDIVIILDLPLEYTLWLQVGGLRPRRLHDHECPLLIQETFLKRLGYQNEFRRSRMGVDVGLKYLVRFHLGPAELEHCRGVTRSGQVEILKGLVSPQWKNRSMCIVGSKLIIYPGLCN